MPIKRLCTSALRGAATCLIALGALAAAPVLGQTPTRPAHIFMEVSLSPDARYVATVEGDTSPAGGDPVVRALVIRSTDAISSVTVNLPCSTLKGCWPASPAWTPDSRRFSFALRDPDTHARSIYQVNADGRGLTRLLAFNGTLQSLRYAPDGQLAMLAVESASKEPGAAEASAPTVEDLDGPAREQRIALLEQGQLRWVSPPDLFVYEYDWTPDGQGLVGTAAPGAGDRNWWVAKLYAFYRDGAQQRLLYAPAGTQQQLAMPRVSRDGKRVAFIAGLMSDFGVTGGDIYTVPWLGGPATAVTPGLGATVTAIRWSCRGQLQGTVLAGAQNQLVEFGNGSGNAAGTVLWQGQDFIGPSRAYSTARCPSNAVALVHQNFNQPPEIEYGAIGKWRDLTRVNAGLATAYRVQSLEWDSGAYRVQGWLILPEASRPPLITIVHGGPASASEPRFIGAGSGQTLLAHGYALFMPNPRGSFGKGEAFVTANVRDFGYGDLSDILAGVDAVSGLGLTDPEKIGLTGHSYGGFMTMWAVTQTDRFKAAVAGAGISNWQSYYGQNGIDEWMIPFFGASVYDDPAVYARSSPINFIRQVRTPTFSYVGAADIECPAPQTLEFAHALKTLGTPSATVIYPDEGHSIHDPGHLADLDARTLSWFDRYLK